MCSIVDKIDKGVISKLSGKVKIISNFAVGFGNIDIIAAKKRNIVVTNTPDVLTNATAEIAMLLILGAARRVPEGMEWAKNKKWKWSADFLMGKQLTGSRLGILGMGRVEERIVSVDGDQNILSIGHLNLTFDHRAWDGAPAARFLKSIAEFINDPGWMRN